MDASAKTKNLHPKRMQVTSLHKPPNLLTCQHTLSGNGGTRQSLLESHAAGSSPPCSFSPLLRSDVPQPPVTGLAPAAGSLALRRRGMYLHQRIYILTMAIVSHAKGHFNPSAKKSSRAPLPAARWQRVLPIRTAELSKLFRSSRYTYYTFFRCKPLHFSFFCYTWLC